MPSQIWFGAKSLPSLFGSKFPLWLNCVGNAQIWETALNCRTCWPHSWRFAKISLCWNMLQNHLILASTRLLYGVLYSDDALPKMKTSNIKLPKITKKIHQCKRDKKYSQTFSAFSILMELSLLSLVMRPIFILRVSMASPAHGVVISVILLAHTRTSSRFVDLLTFKPVTI